MGKLRRGVHLVGWSLAVAVMIALGGTISPAGAQDACQRLDEELVLKRGAALLSDENEKRALETKKWAEPTIAEKAKKLALNAYAGSSSTLLVRTSQRLSSPGEGLATFEDKRIDELRDASKVCIKAFSRSAGSDEDWKVVPLRQVYVSEKIGDKPKRLNAIFDVESPQGKTDYLFVGVLSDAATATLFSHSEKKVSVTSKWCARVAALGFVAAFYLILVWVTYTKETNEVKGPRWLAYTFSPIRISSAWFGEASMSQVQLLIFTFIVAGLLFYHWWTSWVLSELSANLLMLIGISAVGTAASKFAQTVKTSLNDQTARYLIGKGWYGWELIPAQNRATLSHLLLTDGRLDIYKFQMAIFTIVVACYVISVGQASLGDVKISETMLYLIGISQGVYVGGKAVTDRTTDLEAAVQKMIELEDKIHAAKTPDEKKSLYDEYAKAATTAASEFAHLQNRRFPTKFDVARRRLDELKQKISALKEKKEPTPEDQALAKEHEQAAGMTAKELTAWEGTPKDDTVQKIENIDPTVLKP